MRTGPELSDDTDQLLHGAMTLDDWGTEFSADLTSYAGSRSGSWEHRRDRYRKRQSMPTGHSHARGAGEHR